ncbi:hypothetical protein, partial [Niallia circulans]|uniref:hypothetical protein n=1 Tax=Niallia circulans TaxID=1397 RepID=UPI003524918E
LLSLFEVGLTAIFYYNDWSFFLIRLYKFYFHTGRACGLKREKLKLNSKRIHYSHTRNPVLSTCFPVIKVDTNWQVAC